MSTVIRHRFRRKEKASKHRNIRTERTWDDGSVIKFDSKKEAEHYDENLLAIQAGELLFQLRQVPFQLPGGVTWRADFVEFWKDGTVLIVDAKGRRLPAYIRNLKQVEALYPIEITEV